MPNQADTLTDRDRQAIADGFARLYRGRLIPIIRGADGADDGESDDDGDGDGDGRDGGEGRTFSEADVDRIVRERLARDRRSRDEKYADYDEAKAAQKELADLKAEQQTELERERTSREAAETRAEKLEREHREMRLRSTILAEAAKPDRRVADTEAVVALLTGLDADLLELDEDGNPIDIAKAMDSLLEKRDYLVASAGGGRPGGAGDQGARGGRDSTELAELDDPAKVREAVKGLRG